MIEAAQKNNFLIQNFSFWSSRKSTGGNLSEGEEAQIVLYVRIY